MKIDQITKEKMLQDDDYVDYAGALHSKVS